MRKVLCILCCLLVVLSMGGCKPKGTSVGGNDTDISESVVKKDKFEGESTYKEIVSGVWKYSSNYKDDEDYETIEIFKDYTIKIDGRKGKWYFPNISNLAEKPDDITIFVEFPDKSIEEIRIFKSKDRDNKEDDYYSMSTYGSNGIFLNSTDFEMIPITLDNYQEYFETKDYFLAKKDQFGDYVDGWYTYGIYLTIKDGLVVEKSYSEIEYKYSCTQAIYGFDFNKSTGEYKLLDNIISFKDEYLVVDKFSMREDGKYSSVIGSSKAYYVMPGMGYENYDYVAEIPENIDIKRMQGKLCLRKDK